MQMDIITIFPEFFAGIFRQGVVGRAIAGGRIGVTVHDLRGFAHDRHRTVDDRPFGGGEGMVLKPEPLTEAVESLGTPGKGERTRERVILLSAQGERFTQATARELAGLPPHGAGGRHVGRRGPERLVLICGRYEGVDERVTELLCDRELSIGDYVLSGGELAAAVVVDCVARLLPGVLGNEASSEYESFGPADAGVSGAGDGPPRATHGAGGLLDYPHYTRPAEFRGLRVPEALTEGDHATIRRWRREQALGKTLRNRPDLLAGAELSEADRKYLRSHGWQPVDRT
jgi:tRNA (guanine37-N1)-methyltransferase